MEDRRAHPGARTHRRGGPRDRTRSSAGRSTAPALRSLRISHGGRRRRCVVLLAAGTVRGRGQFAVRRIRGDPRRSAPRSADPVETSGCDRSVGVRVEARRRLARDASLEPLASLVRRLARPPSPSNGLLDRRRASMPRCFGSRAGRGHAYRLSSARRTGSSSPLPSPREHQSVAVSSRRSRRSSSSGSRPRSASRSTLSRATSTPSSGRSSSLPPGAGGRDVQKTRTSTTPAATRAIPSSRPGVTGFSSKPTSRSGRRGATPPPARRG